MHMRVFCAAAIVALLAGPAYAQHAPPPTPDPPKSPQEIANEKAAERDYKRSLSNIPDQAPADPWGNARGAESPKPVAKAAAPAKPHAKAGVTANSGVTAN
jgi:hypothetical protein